MSRELGEMLVTVAMGYKFMYEFLDAYAERVNSEEVNSLLGDMALMADGGTADPAMLEDWKDAVETVLKAEDEEGGYSKVNFRLH